MIDRLGRNIDYLRISLTDRCNLRCIYCMPEQGIKKVDAGRILRSEEIVRLCIVMARLGISRIKITGGEPLLRRDLPGLIADIKSIPGIKNVTLTTNGILLKEQLPALTSAGLDGLNISLDTLDEESFFKITRRPGLKEILEALDAASKYAHLPVKINCVALSEELQNFCKIAQLAKVYPVHVRFIEMMPVGPGKKYAGVSPQEIKDLLEREFGSLTQYRGEPLGNGPCRYYEAEGFQGKIGFISAISHRFCGECNRIRLTSQGYLKTCLQYTSGRDLRSILRGGGTDDELISAVRAAVDEKPDGHCFGAKAEVNNTETLCMSQIGG